MSLSGGGNKWTDHVKAFAAKNKVSYMCAMSNPQCSATYKGRKVKPTKEQKKENKENITMSMEDTPAPARGEAFSDIFESTTPFEGSTTPEMRSILKSKSKSSPKKKVGRPRSNTPPTLETLERERSGMAAEDVNVAKPDTKGKLLIKPKKAKVVKEKVAKKAKKAKVVKREKSVSSDEEEELICMNCEKSLEDKHYNEYRGAIICDECYAGEDYDDIRATDEDWIEGLKLKAKKKSGRPVKYATAEEARQAKIANTIRRAKERKEEKKDSKLQAKVDKAKELYNNLLRNLKSWYGNNVDTSNPDWWKGSVNALNQHEKSVGDVLKKLKGVKREDFAPPASSSRPSSPPTRQSSSASTSSTSSSVSFKDPFNPTEKEITRSKAKAKAKASPSKFEKDKKRLYELLEEQKESIKQRRVFAKSKGDRDDLNEDIREYNKLLKEYGEKYKGKVGKGMSFDVGADITGDEEMEVEGGGKEGQKKPVRHVSTEERKIRRIQKKDAANALKKALLLVVDQDEKAALKKAFKEQEDKRIKEKEKEDDKRSFDYRRERMIDALFNDLGYKDGIPPVAFEEALPIVDDNLDDFDFKFFDVDEGEEEQGGASAHQKGVSAEMRTYVDRRLTALLSKIVHSNDSRASQYGLYDNRFRDYTNKYDPDAQKIIDEAIKMLERDGTIPPQRKTRFSAAGKTGGGSSDIDWAEIGRALSEC